MGDMDGTGAYVILLSSFKTSVGESFSFVTSMQYEFRRLCCFLLCDKVLPSC
jgi:hypothetical protein